MTPKLSVTGKPRITCNGHSVSLGPKEYQLLWALMCNAFLTYDKTIEILYPDPDQEPEWAENCVKLYIYHLRKKMKIFGWGIVPGPGPGCRLIQIGTDENSQRIAA